MSANFIQKIIDNIKNEISYKSNVPFKLYHIGAAKTKNAGDLFNKNVMEYYNLRYIKTRTSVANIICIGSLLDKIVVNAKTNYTEPKVKKCKIVGTGFMYEPTCEDEKLIKDIEIYALRGEISKLRLEKILKKNINCPLADAGLLASVMYPVKNISKKYKVGIIPHFLDKNCVEFKNILLDKYNYKIINIEQNIKNLFQEINECDLILSSSLHGLIFSDSYHIPSYQIKFGDRTHGGNYKFMDYYSCYGETYCSPIDLRYKEITDNTIDELLAKFISRKDKVKTKQLELEEIFSKLRNEVSNLS